ncbi:hypothetical protein UlMin_016559, partial [Ulmus minor]
MGNNENLPLSGTYPAKGRVPFRVFAATIFTGICLIFVYRTRFMPAKEEEGRRAWIGLFLTEIWFTIYWFITLVVRWNPIYRHTYKDRLSRRSLSHKYVELCNISVNKSEHCASLIMKYVNRYDEKILPGIDIFVCTADPTVEPPVMVINTVLSAMAYNYPPEKMSVYLSDDGGSDLTFYALLKASRFAKHWLAFCHKFKVEPRSPDAYFRSASQPVDEESISIKVELAGMDSYGGPCYIGTGCFHRRESLTGKTYKEANKQDWKSKNVKTKTRESVDILEEACKALATCTYEQNTQWGKEKGLKYGFPVEDVATGLGIQCKGWRSVYFCPERKGFLGAAPTTLIQTLVQQKRWTEGDFQIFLSRLCPLLHGFKKIPIGLQISYCIFLLWPINCLALYYVLVPPLCLLRGISLFPEV